MADTATIRSIGGLVAEVTVKEQAHDEITITTHPVEKGAAITDHAFKMPAQLTVQAGWSALFEAGGKGNSGSGSLTDLYTKLLMMQSAVQPLEVQTGQRLYQNMLIRSLTKDTDQATENVLLVTIGLQEIILVETLETTMPPNGNRSDPQSASGVANTGTKAAQPLDTDPTSNTTTQPAEDLQDG